MSFLDTPIFRKVKMLWFHNKQIFYFSRCDFLWNISLLLPKHCKHTLIPKSLHTFTTSNPSMWIYSYFPHPPTSITYTSLHNCRYICYSNESLIPSSPTSVMHSTQAVTPPIALWNGIHSSCHPYCIYNFFSYYRLFPCIVPLFLPYIMFHTLLLLNKY